MSDEQPPPAEDSSKHSDSATHGEQGFFRRHAARLAAVFAGLVTAQILLVLLSKERLDSIGDWVAAAVVTILGMGMDLFGCRVRESVEEDRKKREEEAAE